MRQMNVTAEELLGELRKIAQPEKAKLLAAYFKTQPGEYAEGDQFLGVMVPSQRTIAKQFKEMSLQEIALGLASPWHEMRLTSLFVLTHQFKAAMAEDAKSDGAGELLRFYLANLRFVNNWDLVDCSAPKILGAYVLLHRSQRKLLHRLSVSESLWEQRVAIVATMPLVKHGEFDDLLEISRRMLKSGHDLIHKATGWLLREMGKVDPRVLTGFLDQFASEMPRTMLRYAIERFPESVRKGYLGAPRDLPRR
jgi:3-methyladenine DNA glycosylase AlkD